MAKRRISPEAGKKAKVKVTKKSPKKSKATSDRARGGGSTISRDIGSSREGGSDRLTEKHYDRSESSLEIVRKCQTVRTHENFPTTQFRHVNDNVHQNLYIFEPINLIVDTPEFQRLRRLKQTGLTHLVYPNSEHSRFTHSLGVYHLALDFVKHLKEREKHLDITSRDVLCVAIAGLCHDLGHGPFSHTFEHILPEGCDWTHEKGSTQIFERIMKQPHVRLEFEKFLNYDEDITFVKELINPPKQFMVDGKWQLKGRTIEKSFLYGFVSNAQDSYDVDKYDYLLRDAKASSATPLNQTTITRIRDSMRVGIDPKLGFLRLSYSFKVQKDLMDVAAARRRLHENHYQHQKVRASEHLLVEALKLGAPFLMFRGSDQTFYTLTESYKNLDAYLRIDDAVISMIRNMDPAAHEDIGKAQNLLEQLDRRQVPPLVAERNVKINESLKKSQFEAYLQKELEKAPHDCECCGSFVVLEKVAHSGMGVGVHPLSMIRVYNHKTADEYPVTTDDVDKNSLRDWFNQNQVGQRIFLVYASFNSCTRYREALFEIVEKDAIEHDVSTPTKRTNSERADPSGLSNAVLKPSNAETKRSRACRRLYTQGFPQKRMRTPPDSGLQNRN